MLHDETFSALIKRNTEEMWRTTTSLHPEFKGRKIRVLINDLITKQSANLNLILKNSAAPVHTEQ